MSRAGLSRAQADALRRCRKRGGFRPVSLLNARNAVLMRDLGPWWRHIPLLGLIWAVQFNQFYRRRLICASGGVYTRHLTLTERGRQALDEYEAG
ncbi:hypothetical protein [Amorphus coralli]|uniref:hypothetical protein n=1 Tax=Amorphus coralli TaxID=340680 RepID=UPI000364BB1E|nr:hypothetical protein [Amorphus coralli]